MASATITNLKLLPDSNDIIWYPAAALSDLQAVEQAIYTRLELFQGEWWENLNEGTPYFQQILGQRFTPKNQELMQLAISQRISGTPYVSGVRDIVISFDPVTRGLSYSATAQTAFGAVKIQFEPGATVSNI